MREFHALEIFTDNGNGDLISYTNAAVGAAGGVFAYITGRPGLDGSRTVAGDTTRTVWYQDFLTLEGSRISVSRVADLIEAGGMASQSPPAFAIKNVGGIRDTLRAAGIFLERCRVVYYFVRSADLLTFTFYKRGTWVIDELPHGSTDLSFRCVDNSKGLFGNLPKVAASSVPGIQVAEENTSKYVPIALGRVAKSPLVSVSKNFERVQLGYDGSMEKVYTVPAEDYNIDTWQPSHAFSAGARVLPASPDGFYYVATTSGTSASSEPSWPQSDGATITDGSVTWRTASNRTLNLKIMAMPFLENDARLVGKYLVVVHGTRQSKKILSNQASNPITGHVVITIQGFLDGEPEDWDFSSVTTSIWLYEVANFESVLVASTNEIFEYKRPLETLSLAYFNSDSKAFIGVSEIHTQESTENVGRTGFPGFSILSKSVDVEGNLHAFLNIRPKGYPHPSNPIIDGSYSTYSEYLFSSFLAEQFPDFPLPNLKSIKGYDALYLLLDISHRYNGGSIANPNLRVTIRLIDKYTREAVTEVVSATLHNSNVPTTFEDKNILPRSYYGLQGDDANFFAIKERLNIAAAIPDNATDFVYTTARLNLQANGTSLNQYVLRIREIGLVAKKTINLTSETIYVGLDGEVFGSQWRSGDAPGVARRTASDPVLNVADVVEHLLRNHDYNHPAWKAGCAYKVGEKVRSAADNGFIYICAVAGTSHAATEPTFPTTLGATVTDGTVTWRALDTLKIDCASFDVLAGQRANWYVGHTLTDSKPSLTIYKELARHGFFGMLMDRHGRLSVSAWRENQTPVITFSSAAGGNIIEGTLNGRLRPSPMSRCYNDFMVRYGLNPASKSYARQIGITNADQPEFPGESETIDPGTGLGSFQVFRLYEGGGVYKFHFITFLGHGLESGGYVSLSGNNAGFDFAPLVVSVENTTEFYVSGFLTASGFSTSGTLRSHTDIRLKWKAFAPGFTNYAYARSLWEIARNSYLVTKTIQRLPEELGDCPWFPDPEATDPAGNRLWPDLPGGDDHPAARYLEQWVTWGGIPKYSTPPFEVEKSAAHLALEVYQPCEYVDAAHTAGLPVQGWISEITDLPSEGTTKPERLRIVVTLKPVELVESDIIDEQDALDTDIIDEDSADPTDIIDEG